MAFALALPVMLSLAAVPGDCRVMRIASAAGDVIVEDDTINAACPVDAVPPKLRYDPRRRLAIARRELAMGEALGRVYLPRRPGVLPGDRVQLVARLGHVTVLRQMTALQPGQINQRFFARDAQGHVVVAPRLAEAMIP